MALFPTPVEDYTDYDFDALRARVFSLISSVFTDWTDQQVSNFGNILVDAFCHIGDVLGFYLDNHARESRISTATQRRSLVALGKLLGYVPAGRSAATVDVTISLAEVAAADVELPAGTLVRTLAVADPVYFQLLADVTIPAGDLSVTAVTENSRSWGETFTPNGQPNQQIRLAQTPFLDGSLVLTDSLGAFTKVDNFLASTSTDRHFTLVTDEDDRARVTFGNGVNGVLPSGLLTASYKTGGGSAGNVDAGTIQRVDGTFTDVLGNSVTLSATNAADAAGGDERETREQIRQNAPASLRVLNRTVAREDYEINALRVPGVARALMLTSNQRAGIPENRGHLHVIPDGYGLPSTALKEAVETMVTETYPNTLTFVVDVLDPEYLTVNITATVFLSPGTAATTAKANVLANLGDLFDPELDDGSANPAVGFGFDYKDADGNPAGEIPYSDIFNAIRDASGIRKIGAAYGSLLINDSVDDLTIGVQQFPKLGTVTLINGDSGGEL